MQLAQKLKELDEERTKGMEEASASIAELRSELAALKESQGTMVEAAEAMGRAAKEQAEAAAAEAGGGAGFRLHVSRAIIRNPAQGKSYAAYQFEVSLNGRSNFFFQRWKLIDKFVADVRAQLPSLPKPFAAWCEEWCALCGLDAGAEGAQGAEGDPVGREGLDSLGLAQGRGRAPPHHMPFAVPAL